MKPNLQEIIIKTNELGREMAKLIHENEIYGLEEADFLFDIFQAGVEGRTVRGIIVRDKLNGKSCEIVYEAQG